MKLKIKSLNTKLPFAVVLLVALLIFFIVLYFCGALNYMSRSGLQSNSHSLSVETEKPSYNQKELIRILVEYRIVYPDVTLGAETPRYIVVGWIVNSSGNIVKTLPVHEVPYENFRQTVSGSFVWTWDQRDDATFKVSPGKYYVYAYVLQRPGAELKGKFVMGGSTEFKIES